MSERMTLAQLCEPDRKQDEALLRIIRAFEDSGIAVLAPDEAEIIPLQRSQEVLPISPRLAAMAGQVGRRTEAEARGQLHPIFENILAGFRP